MVKINLKFVLICSLITLMITFNLNQDDNLLRDFQEFLKTHNKIIKTTEEFNLKFENYKQNLKNIQAKLTHNNSTHRHKLNYYSDISKYEFKKQYLTLNLSHLDHDENQQQQSYNEQRNTNNNNYNVNSVEDDEQVFLKETDPKSSTNNNTSNHNETVLNLTVVTNNSIFANSNNTNNITDNANSNNNSSNITQNELPHSFDWREKNVVGPVLVQGGCGGCWAFSATANVQSQYAIKYNKLLNFSVNQLLDCDPLNQACNGGATQFAFDYIKNSGGLELEDNYPYKGYKDQCLFDPTKAVAKVKNIYRERSRNEVIMKELLIKNGPISGALDASELQFYDGGVYKCDYKSNYKFADLDHAILIVGYGRDPVQGDYWIVKNSWGDYWGDNGYFKLARGNGACGINLYVISAFIE
jgi:C1A family cysteine protease